MPIPSLNSPAPDFTLPDQDGAQHTLSHHRGAWVLLYFYPKDDTAGCTKEACMIRDALPDFDKAAAGTGANTSARAKMKVFGVSVDSVASHKKFAEKYKLSFTLLADEDKKVVNEYGVWGPKKFMGKEYEGTMRTSFLINPEGKIVKIYENVKPEIHAAQVLEDLRSLAR